MSLHRVHRVHSHVLPGAGLGAEHAPQERSPAAFSKVHLGQDHGVSCAPAAVAGGEGRGGTLAVILGFSSAGGSATEPSSIRRTSVQLQTTSGWT